MILVTLVHGVSTYQGKYMYMCNYTLVAQRVKNLPTM